MTTPPANPSTAPTPGTAAPAPRAPQEPLRIGNASGFYGDRFDAVREMLGDGPLDVLTGDYLAELTMGILAHDRFRDPETGYAKTFVRQMETCLGTALDKGVTIVVNAGGLNPAGLANALRQIADRLGLAGRAHIGYVTGDAIERVDAITANAYLGAFGIAECLRGGANVVVTGRVTDASLVIGPSIAAFGWGRDDFDALAGAMVAGHVIECGPQTTGGNYAFFREITDLRHPGFPIAEISADGSAVITKHTGTGGAVTVGTVTAQLLYEIGSPAYLGPDVVAHLDTVMLTQEDPDRVRIAGVHGAPPPPTLKVGVTRLGGYRNSMTFVLCGLDIEAKAELVRAQLIDAIGPDGLTFDLVRTDHPEATRTEEASALLHVHVKDLDGKRAGRAFSQAAVELALASYPGTTLTTPPSDASPFATFSSDTAAQDAVAHTAVVPSGERIRIAPPPVTDPNAGTPPTNATAHSAPPPSRPTTRRSLGEVVGARAGDKGPDANLGLWVRNDEAYDWLRTTMTTASLRELLPEAADLAIDRYELPNLRSINFVLHGLLGDGVGGSTRFDPQAKALGELIRARVVDMPADLR
jgi:Acyclic terpene utilisation family protein AtuA